MIEWADTYQRLVFQHVGGEVHILCVYEDHDKEWESSVIMPLEEFRKLLGRLDMSFGNTQR